MRVFIILGISIACLAIPGVALASNEQALQLSLVRSQEMALSHNLDLQQAAYAVELSEAELERTRVNNLLNTSVMAMRTAEFNLKRATHDYKEVRERLVLEGVPNAYFEILRAAREKQIAEFSVAQAEQNQAMIEDKLSFGDASELDLRKADVTLTAAQLSLTQAENNHALAVMDLNRLLGLPLTTKLELTDALSAQTVEISPEEAIEQALDSRNELKEAEEALALAQLKWELTQNDYTAELDKVEARIERETARLQQENAILEVMLEVNELFLALEERMQAIEVANKTKQEKQISSEIAQAQYQRGLITSTDLLDAQIELTEARTTALEAIFNYALARNAFLRAVGVPMEESRATSAVGDSRQ